MRLGPVVIASLTVSLLAFAADPLSGTWKINIEKSKLSDPARWKDAVAIIESHGDGFRQTMVRTTPDGKTTKSTSVISYDGKDTPVEGRPGDSTTAQRIDSFHLRIVYKSNGKQTGVLESTISPDGKTVTDTFKGIGRSGKPLDEIRVYDKQSDTAK